MSMKVLEASAESTNDHDDMFLSSSLSSYHIKYSTGQYDNTRDRASTGHAPAAAPPCLCHHASSNPGVYLCLCLCVCDLRPPTPPPLEWLAPTLPCAPTTATQQPSLRRDPIWLVLPGYLRVRVPRGGWMGTQMHGHSGITTTGATPKAVSQPPCGFVYHIYMPTGLPHLTS